MSVVAKRSPILPTAEHSLKSIESHSPPVNSVQETSPNSLRRRTRVDGTADNADISQSQAASDDRLLSRVTLGRVERRK